MKQDAYCVYEDDAARLGEARQQRPLRGDSVFGGGTSGIVVRNTGRERRGFRRSIYQGDDIDERLKDSRESSQLKRDGWREEARFNSPKAHSEQQGETAPATALPPVAQRSTGVMVRPQVPCREREVLLSLCHHWEG